MYPGGTAKAELQRRLESHPDGTLDRDAVLNTLVEEVAELALQLQNREPDVFAV